MKPEVSVLGGRGPRRKSRPPPEVVAGSVMAAASWRRAVGPGRPRWLHEAAPGRDVLLFEHERGRFFGFLGLFCAAQGVFWTAMAANALAGPQSPRRAPPDGPGAEVAPARDPPGGPEAEVGPARGSALWRRGLALACAAIGSLVLTAGLLFSHRSVRSVLLRAGGQRVTVTTHAPLGLGAQFTVPLRHVSCLAHRGQVPAVLPLKVKGRRFYFLLDKAGRFPNLPLFDVTVGAYRNL
ncbi:transmembrane protein 223 [Tachyglossus aculeatus]|uniref:transmembrane protein 223 n=1 Tax=Tachyglossus aculeatus TaxID=9261 RepID=UPI0018F4C1B9|nr:transmembrane protein 223 [Tachyglossus aculeatus]